MAARAEPNTRTLLTTSTDSARPGSWPGPPQMRASSCGLLTMTGVSSGSSGGDSGSWAGTMACRDSCSLTLRASARISTARSRFSGSSKAGQAVVQAGCADLADHPPASRP